MGDDGIHIVGPISNFTWKSIPRLCAVSRSGNMVVFNCIIVDEVGEWADINIAGSVTYGHSDHDGTYMLFDNPDDAMMCWLRWS